MAESPAKDLGKPRKSRAILILAALSLILGAGGFASTWLGFWSPMSFLKAEAKEKPPATPAIEFVDIPRIQLTIPASRPRTLFLSAKIETDAAGRAQIQPLMPRVLDAFNTFLSDIDPGAFDKRGVLEIIRAELVTRTRYVLGEAPVKDLLITEFMLQ